MNPGELFAIAAFLPYSLPSMPIIKSAIKRMQQNEERRRRRLPVKTSMKTMIRKLNDLVAGGKRDEAVALLPQVHKAIDMAAKRHIIHSKTAARKKSFVAKLVGGKK